MKTYEEMAHNALERIEEYKTEQKKRRKTAAAIAIPAASLCLAAIIGFGIRGASPFKIGAPLPDTEKTGQDESFYSSDNTPAADTGEVPEAEASQGGEILPFAPEQSIPSIGGNTVTTTAKQNNAAEKSSGSQVITGDDVKGAGTSGYCLFWWKKKLTVGGALYWAMEENPGGTFAVIASYRPATAEITSFTYEGKTLAELAIEADNERILPLKMKELLKYGDELKYGTALYETGTPSGVKWDKRLYEEKVAYFGEELLNKYIVDGKFLRKELERDIAALEIKVTTSDGTSTIYSYEGTALIKYKKAYDAYMETVLSEAEKQLSQKNIRCQRAPYSNNSLILTVTAAELENLPLTDLKNWSFDLASDNLKGTHDDGSEQVVRAVN